MAEFYSNADDDTIIGTSDGDSVEFNGNRDMIDGGAGNDTISATGFLPTVHGGEGNDSISVYRSYSELYGDDGDDSLFIAANSYNIANVTLSGGEGDDEFWFYLSDNHKIFSSKILDFDKDHDSIVLPELVSLHGYLTYKSNDDGDLVFSDAAGKINFTLKNISDFNDVANATVQYADDLNHVGYSTFEDAVVLPEYVTTGLSKTSNGFAIVDSAYEGNLWLGGVDLDGNAVDSWSDDSIIDINAVNDTVGGRMLAGNAQDNSILAGSGGASMWGGEGKDTLVGGKGDDTFIAGMGEGDVRIDDYTANDTVYLHNVNFADLKYLAVFSDDSRAAMVKTTDDTYIEVWSSRDEETTTINLADGSRVRYNSRDNAWQSYDPSAEAWSDLPSINGTPVGLIKRNYDDEIYVYSDYVGDFRLSDLNDSTFTEIIAFNDSISGRLLEGDDQDNYIYAGLNGSSLWGGGGDDFLFGGDGADTFIAGMGEGDVYIFNYAANDTVYLYNVNFSDLKSLATLGLSSNRIINIETTDGTNIDVWASNDEETTTIQLADGSRIQYNAVNNAWQMSDSDVSSWSDLTSLNGMPVGLAKSSGRDDVIQVHSDYVGDFNLTDLNDSDVTIVNAYSDSLSGRVLIGDAQDNSIRAGSGGAYMYGGEGNDTLDGGAGADTFVAGMGEGDVYINNYTVNDTVYLHNINFADLKYLAVFGNSSYRSAMVKTTDDTFIEVRSSSDEETTTIDLADGSRVRYNAGDNAWQSYDPSAEAWSELPSINGMPVGLIKRDYDDRIYVYSDYAGDFRLADLNDRTVTRIDAYNDSISGRLLEGDDQDNRIYAGTEGASLLGGDGDDTLIGGDGDDTFVAGLNEGNTTIVDCSAKDIVLLKDIDSNNLWDNVTGLDFATDEDGDEIGIEVMTSDGNTIEIRSASDANTITVQLADSSKWRYNRSAVSWTFVVETPLPDGLSIDGRSVIVSSNYVGDVALGGVDWNGNAVDGWSSAEVMNDEVVNIDAEDDTVGGRLLIGNDKSNDICAGDGGDTLWGGTDGWDDLYGGSGSDVFVVGEGAGDIDLDIWDCEDDDLVYFYNINLADLSEISPWDSGGTSRSLDFTTNDGTTIEIWNRKSTTTSITVQYADGTKQRYDYSTDAWSTV